MKIIIILLLLLPAAAYAQLRLPATACDSVARTPIRMSHGNAAFILNRTMSPFEYSIPRNYYAQHLTFFCRQELKMQQAHVPVTFRVGTMDQCNYLEQKPGYKINKDN